MTTPRVLTDDEWDRHFRIGLALGISRESMLAEPRDKLVHVVALTDLEPCESCGTPVFAATEGGQVSVVEPVGSPQCRDDDWWQDIGVHACRDRAPRSHLAEQVGSAP